MKLFLLDRLDASFFEVARTSGDIFIIKAAGALLGLALSVVLARTTGASGAGIFFLTLSLATIACVLTRFGLDNVLLRLTAVYHSQQNTNELRAVYVKGLGLGLTGSVFAAVALWLSAPAIAVSVLGEPSLVQPLRVMVVGIPLLTLLALQTEVLKGIRRVRTSQAINPTGLQAVALVGMLILGSEYGVRGAVVAYVGAVAVMAAIGVAVCLRAIPKLRVCSSEVTLKSLLQDGIPLFIVAILGLLGDHLPQLILSAFSGAESVGTFAIANRIAVATAFVLVTINTVAAPKYASLFSSGDTTGLGALSRDVTKLALLITSPLLALILIFPEALLSLFGSEFTEAKSALRILALGQLINVATGSVGYLLAMTSHQVCLLYSTAASASITILACMLLIPSYGALGAAIGCALGIAAKNLICTYYVWRRLKIVTIPLPVTTRVSSRSRSS